MTTTGIVLLSLMFIIIIMGVYIMGQAETIKFQDGAIKELIASGDKMYDAAGTLLDLSKQRDQLINERDALRKTLEELK